MGGDGLPNVPIEEGNPALGLQVKLRGGDSHAMKNNWKATPRGRKKVRVVGLQPKRGGPTLKRGGLMEAIHARNLRGRSLSDKGGATPFAEGGSRTEV